MSFIEQQKRKIAAMYGIKTVPAPTIVIQKSENNEFVGSNIHEHQRSQNSHLAKSFMNTTDYLEKGGKRAVVGEVRTYGGQKWVKHSDGWVHVTDKGKTKLHANDGKISEGTEDHAKHFNTHVGRHDRESGDKVDQTIPPPDGSKEDKEHDGGRKVKEDKSLEKYKSLQDREKLEVDGVTYKLELIKHPKDKGDYHSTPTFSIKLTHPSTGEIKVMPNAIRFHSGYDQGPGASTKQQWYADIAGYGTGNGGGQSSTNSVFIGSRYQEHLSELFSSKKHYIDSYHKYQDSIVSFPKGTKIEEIKESLNQS